jgi:hypothetical protein
MINGGLVLLVLVVLVGGGLHLPLLVGGRLPTQVDARPMLLV